MLDAGHYGKTYNKGAVAGYYESETVWKIHTYLKPALEAYGFEVGVTRKNQDENPTPEQRGRMAKGYDLFLSLHTNALDDETLDRPYMICFLDVAGELAVKSKAAGHKLGAAIEKVIGTKQPYQIWQREYPGDRDKNGKQDDEYYGVLFGSRAVGAVGVLVEHTFHTNERSALWLMDDGNLKKLAQAEADAIAEYYGVAAPSEPVQPAPAELAPYLVTITTTQLNVRKGAGTAYPITGTVGKDEVYTIVAEEQVGAIVWGKLKSGAGWIGLTGYTQKLSLPAAPEKPPEVIPAKFEPYAVKITTGALNIRKDAGTVNPIVGVAKEGEIYTITDEKPVGSTVWGKLDTGGWIGLTGYTEKLPAPPAADAGCNPKFEPYNVKITAGALNVRKGAGTANPISGVVKQDEIHTIIAEEKIGSVVWGKLKSGLGWIGLTGYTLKLGVPPAPAPAPLSPPVMAKGSSTVIKK